MALFDLLIDEMAGKCALGADAGPVARGLLQAILGGAGGFPGFVERIELAGLGADLANWLGRPDALSLNPTQLGQVFDASTLKGLGDRLGLGAPAVTAAAAFATPKLVGLLTPGGGVAAAPSPEIASFLSGADRPVATSGAAASKSQGWYEGGGGVLALVAVVGLLTHLFAGEDKAVAPAPGPAVAAAPAKPMAAAAPAVQPAPAPVAMTAASFEFNARKDGTAQVSGAVADQQSRTTLLDALKSAFGAEAIKGDIAVDPHRAPAPWLAKIAEILAALKVPGLTALFDGGAIHLGGVGEDELSRLRATLAGLLGGEVKIGSLSDHLGEVAAHANAGTAAALAALKPGFGAADLIAALNLSIINFASGSAEIPEQNLELLRAAAAQFKQLPAGTTIEIAGYTDNTGNAEANLALSQRRADAVRAALTEAGVSGETLVAKGYGDADPVASNDTLDGRFRNRRIEYRLAKP